MTAIKTLEDARVVSEKVMAQLVKGKVAYFSVLVGEEDITSSCFFTPVTKLSKNKSMIMVGDYEKILKLLLSHPHVSNIEYDEKANVISAVFTSPYPINSEEEDYENPI